jgi:hypothetical protein
MNMSDKYNSIGMRIRVKIEVLRVNVTNPISHRTKYFGHFSCCFQNSRGTWYTCFQFIMLIDNNFALRSQERRTAVLELKCGFKTWCWCQPQIQDLCTEFNVNWLFYSKCIRGISAHRCRLIVATFAEFGSKTSNVQINYSLYLNKINFLL